MKYAPSPRLLACLAPYLCHILAGAAALLSGCPREASPPAPPAEPRPSVALRVVVVNQPELAEAIHRLRGEWVERSGGTLTVSAKPWQEVAENQVDADVLVFPSRYLGELCAGNRLRPVRPHVLESDALQATDFFPLVRHELIQWGGEVIALPLGVDPIGIGGQQADRPSLAFLWHAAPEAISKERLGVLFDTETMEPRIAEQPFVDALAQFAQSADDNAAGSMHGEASIAVLGYSDWLMAVTSSSRNAASAFQLLEWLALAETSAQLARAGQGALPVRRSLASSPAWYGAALSAGRRAELGEALDAALGRPEHLIIPRIPAVDRYLAALDQAVDEVRSEGVGPEQALELAAQRWEEITDALGRDAQRQAYWKHLGIAQP